MADAATERTIERIVLQHIASGVMFTDYDVTTSARQQGCTVQRDEAREIIQNLFKSGVMGTTYQRTLVDVGSPTETFVYHRFSHDPRSYSFPGGSRPSPPSGIQTLGGFFGNLIAAMFGRRRTPDATSPLSTRPQPDPQVPRQTSRRSAPPSSPPPRPNATIDLDASQFLPISRKELLRAAKGSSLWSSVWFGRRDLIPPVDDARTMLVDRGMLTEGIISAEELANIHRVGAEMDLHRPAETLIRHKAQKAGQAAVDEARAERARIKEQKKQEAAERKAVRRAAIEDRRANDIMFLGRRVSGKLHERKSDADRLHQLELPNLQTPADIAVAMQISISQLRWLAFHAEVAERTHYVSFEVPKKSGGLRRLSAPHAKLAEAQRWILEQVLNKLPTEPAAHGFVSGRNILSNANEHVQQAVVINMDLENFFPGITFPRVRHMFARLGYSGAVATIFALLCTECPRRTVTFNGVRYHVATGPRGLPQGACTSPAISNQITIRLDRRLQGLARKMQLNYTRYADDITLSGGQDLKERVGYVMARVRHFAEEEGFLVNHKKSRVQRRNGAQSVTGLVVNERPTVARKKIRQIRAILHRAKSEGLEAQNRHNHPNFRAWLEGYIAFIAMTRPDIAARFREALKDKKD